MARTLPPSLSAWLELFRGSNSFGDYEQAKHHALGAYEYAWADGDPYVQRYELIQSTKLLEKLKIPIPNLPAYDATKDEPFPWERDVNAAIEKLRAKKEARSTNRGQDEPHDEPRPPAPECWTNAGPK